MSAERFSDLLRRHRHRAGFSQDDLAERAGLSTRAISDLERGVKQRPYPETVRQLATALDLTGDTLVQFRLAATNRPDGSPSVAPTASDGGPSRLPEPLTPLIGREDDLAALTHLLQPGGEIRLVALTGPGGVGKTRLSLQLAHETTSHFRDGVAFLELAAIGDPAQVMPVLAMHLGVREHPERSPLESLIRTLQDQQRLLVLDNLEQVISVAPEVATLLQGCPELKVLATSRAPLRVLGEREYPLSPLTPPEPARIGSPELLLRYPAVRLFVARAQAVEPAFTVTPDNARDVAAICHAVDGLPLALELAAVRMKTLSPAELARHLGQRLNVLNRGPQNLPRRHQALRETIAWSHQLLTPAQQETFAAFSVFVGGATLDAVATVLFEGDNLTTLDALTDLLDQSLLVRTDDQIGTARFQMLETIREFAAERLAESGNHDALAQCHADHFLAMAEEGEQALIGPDQARWMKLLEADYGNLRAAIAWHVEREDAESSQRMGSALWRFWAASGRLREARDWLDRALALDPESITPARGRALIRSGNTLLDLDLIQDAEERYTQAQALFGESDDEIGVARANLALGNVLRNVGQYDRAADLLQQSIRTWERVGYDNELWISRLGMAIALMGAEDVERARPYLQLISATAVSRAHDAYAWYWSGWLAMLDGCSISAVRDLELALEAFAEIDDRIGTGMTLCALALAAGTESQDIDSTTVLMEALQIQEEVGTIGGMVDCLEVMAIRSTNLSNELRVALLSASVRWRSLSRQIHPPGIGVQVSTAHMSLRNDMELSVYSQAWDQGQADDLGVLVHRLRSILSGVA